MKNQTTKLNKSKLVARVMLVVFLMTSVVSFTACGGGLVNRTIQFRSYGELLEYLERYNSQNDGFVNTYISFDFDNNERVQIYEYSLKTVWKLQPSFKNGVIDTEYADHYDKDRPNDSFGCDMIFYIDDVASSGEKIERAYQIYCFYTSPKDYNFYQGDDVAIKCVDTYYIGDDSDNNIKTDFHKLYAVYYNWESFHEQFGDISTYDVKEDCYRRYYTYMYLFEVQINGKTEMRFKLTSDNEMNQEKLNEICTLLKDNLVIINTEG